MLAELKRIKMEQEGENGKADAEEDSSTKSMMAHMIAQRIAKAAQTIQDVKREDKKFYKYRADRNKEQKSML